MEPKPNIPEAAQPDATTWSQDRRFKFIDYRLRWEGRLRRTDLTEFFNISLPQASADLAKYDEAAPENLEYNLSQKCYVRGPEFKARYGRSSPQMYLSELAALSTGILERSATFLGWTPPVGLAPAPVRTFDGDVLAALLGAIREQLSMEVEYQSMDPAAHSTREISPTALAYDGTRWHVRAYCHFESRFRDFVLGRLLSAKAKEKSPWTENQDQAWNTLVMLHVAPASEMNDTARKAVELEFGMLNGQLRIEVRQALLFHTLRRLRLERSDVGTAASPNRLVLLNRDEVEAHLDAQ